VKAPLRDVSWQPMWRKVILIDGIVNVVDPGFAVQRKFDPQLGTGSLVSPISKSRAKLRASRAGITQPGRAYRLYPSASFCNLPQHTPADILCSDLSSVVLWLKKMGVSDISKLDFIETPPSESITHALQTLCLLGALDKDEKITELGSMMSEFCLDTKLAKVLITSPLYHCSNEIASIVAMLSSPDCFVRPKNRSEAADNAKALFFHECGDHLTLLNVYHAFKQNDDNLDWCNDNFLNIKALKAADKLRTELCETMTKLGLELVSTSFMSQDYYTNIQKCLLTGFFMQVAHLKNRNTGLYLTVKHKKAVALHPSTSLQHKPECCVYDRYVPGVLDFIKVVTVVDPHWLQEIAPHYCTLSDSTQTNFEQP